jgi:pimeloyl-ACP methyl ester carboxylesterase
VALESSGSNLKLGTVEMSEVEYGDNGMWSFRLRLALRAVLTATVLGAAFLLALVEPAATQNVVSDLPLAGGGIERVVFTSPANPNAILVMFAGGDGTVEIADSGTIYRHAGNFLLRTRPLWLAQGFAVEILGAPNNTSLNGRRQTEAYADAIGRAVDFARTRAGAPVWLVGTSAGTTGAANGAAHLTGRLAGLVMTSSVSRRYNNAGETVFDTELGAIAIPVLIVANRGDSCAVTPPDDAATIAAALIRSPRKEVVYVESDQIGSPPCEAMSPHGYLGVEAAVVQGIADWIRATPAK